MKKHKNNIQKWVEKAESIWFKGLCICIEKENLYDLNKSQIKYLMKTLNYRREEFKYMTSDQAIKIIKDN